MIRSLTIYASHTTGVYWKNLNVLKMSIIEPPPRQASVSWSMFRENLSISGDSFENNICTPVRGNYAGHRSIWTARRSWRMSWCPTGTFVHVRPCCHFIKPCSNQLTQRTHSHSDEQLRPGGVDWCWLLRQHLAQGSPCSEESHRGAVIIAAPMLPCVDLALLS